MRLGQTYDPSIHAIGNLVIPTSGGVRGGTTEEESIIRDSFMPRVRIINASFVCIITSYANLFY
jgi:hypothetical protein